MEAPVVISARRRRDRTKTAVSDSAHSWNDNTKNSPETPSAASPNDTPGYDYPPGFALPDSPVTPAAEYDPAALCATPLLEISSPALGEEELRPHSPMTRGPYCRDSLRNPVDRLNTGCRAMVSRLGSRREPRRRLGSSSWHRHAESRNGCPYDDVALAPAGPAEREYRRSDVIDYELLQSMTDGMLLKNSGNDTSDRQQPESQAERRVQQILNRQQCASDDEDGEDADAETSSDEGAERRHRRAGWPAQAEPAPRQEVVGELPPPNPLFVPPVKEEDAVPMPQTGIGRVLQQPLHDHALNAVEDPVPGYVSRVPLKELITKSRAARAQATDQWVPRTVFNYEFGQPRKLITHYTAKPGEAKKDGHLEGTPLRFESRFESGNLSKAVQVAPFGYELCMQNDVNTRGNTQWFYFACSDMVPGIEYTFWIRNFYKKKSLYNDGMMPVGFSMKDSKQGWKRCGEDISYYKGEHRRSDDKGFLYCLCFKLTFDHAEDTVYLANFYPYTYTNLQRHLHELQSDPQRQKTFRRRKLCHSLAGNSIDMLTVTNPVSKPEEMKPRRKVVISARVHPGEVNASWMMKGVLEFLTADTEEANELRNTYIFMLIPMLNPDGVINGNYRTSLVGRDLNRQWLKPKQSTMPAVFHTKKLLVRLVKEATQNNTASVAFYIDLHGHSRAKGVFTYGCPPKKEDQTQMEVLKSVGLPWLVSQKNKDFSFGACTYNLSKSKKATGRVVSYSECGVSMSYTLEASFMGGTDNIHFTPTSLLAIGHGLSAALMEYARLMSELEASGTHSGPLSWPKPASTVTSEYSVLLQNLPETLAGDTKIDLLSGGETDLSDGSDSEPSAGNVSDTLIEIEPAAVQNDSPSPVVASQQRKVRKDAVQRKRKPKYATQRGSKPMINPNSNHRGQPVTSASPQGVKPVSTMRVRREPIGNASRRPPSFGFSGQEAVAPRRSSCADGINPGWDHEYTTTAWGQGHAPRAISCMSLGSPSTKPTQVVNQICLGMAPAPLQGHVSSEATNALIRENLQYSSSRRGDGPGSRRATGVPVQPPNGVLGVGFVAHLGAQPDGIQFPSIFGGLMGGRRRRVQ